MSMQGSAMMYVTAALSLLRRDGSGRQLLDELLGALVEGRFRDHLVEAGGVRAAQPAVSVWFVKPRIGISG